MFGISEPGRDISPSLTGPTTPLAPLLTQLHPLYPRHHQLRPIIESHINRMSPQPSADDHIPSIRRKTPSAAPLEKMELGRHKPSKAGKPHRSPMKMTAQSQISPPSAISAVKKGRMGQKDLIFIPGGPAQPLFYVGGV